MSLGDIRNDWLRLHWSRLVWFRISLFLCGTDFFLRFCGALNGGGLCSHLPPQGCRNESLLLWLRLLRLLLASSTVLISANWLRLVPLIVRSLL